MAYTGKTSKMIAAQMERKAEERKEEQQKQNKSNNPLEDQLLGSGEQRVAVGYTLEPSVKKKIIKLAKKHNYKSASSFVNDVFKNW